jgi:hypothetical protein
MCYCLSLHKVKKMPTEEVFAMKLGTQGGEVPVNMIRPRTMSGSRFLTDIVSTVVVILRSSL